MVMYGLHVKIMSQPRLQRKLSRFRASLCRTRLVALGRAILDRKPGIFFWLCAHLPQSDPGTAPAAKIQV